MPAPTVSMAPSAVEPTYTVTAGIDGEIYPAIANFSASQKASERRLPTVAVTVTNPAQVPLKNRITVSVPGWTDQEILSVEVAPGASRTLQFAPVFLPRAFSNREIAPATAIITVSDTSGKTVYTTTAPVRLRAAEDMYWGKHFKFAPFIAAWVTPHDPQVEAVLSRAKESMPGRRLPGSKSGRMPPRRPTRPICRRKPFIRLYSKRACPT